MLVVSPNMTWPTSTVRTVRVEILGQRADLRGDRADVAGVAAVAVELDVRQVGAVAVEGAHQSPASSRRCPAGRGSGRGRGRDGAAPVHRRPARARPGSPRGVTSNAGTTSSSVATFPFPCFHVSTPPGLTTFTPNAFVAREQSRRRRPGAGRARRRGRDPSHNGYCPCRTRNALSMIGVSSSSWCVCRAMSGAIAASTAVA